MARVRRVSVWCVDLMAVGGVGGGGGGGSGGDCSLYHMSTPIVILLGQLRRGPVDAAAPHTLEQLAQKGL